MANRKDYSVCDPVSNQVKLGAFTNELFWNLLFRQQLKKNSYPTALPKYGHCDRILDRL